DYGLRSPTWTSGQVPARALLPTWSPGTTPIAADLPADRLRAPVALDNPRRPSRRRARPGMVEVESPGPPLLDAWDVRQRRWRQRNDRNLSDTEAPVRLTSIGQDPDSNPTGSPTIYRRDRDSWVFQGWVVTHPAVLAQMDIPEGETCVEIPDR